MIYTNVGEEDPLQQGDILYPVPMFVPLTLDTIPKLSSNGDVISSDWVEDLQMKSLVTSGVAVKPVMCIVASQSCDASRASYISCFLIDEFENVTNKKLDGKEAKGRSDLIVAGQRKSGKWFYLPQDDNFMIQKPMAINFGRIFQLQRESLISKLDTLRIGKLNSVAYEHYREMVAQYFTRYSYNEWYSLAADELSAYCKKISPEEKSKMKIYDWQHGSETDDEKEKAVTP